MEDMKGLNVPDTNLERVVVIGGGFAGINTIKKLKNKGFQVVLLDKHNYHTFQPLLYQVATAGLEPDSIAYPLRHIFKGYKHFHFRMALVEQINAQKKYIQTNIGQLEYDHLVIATGSSTNYFGNENIAEQSIPMKSVPEALNLRSIMLQSFEAASLTDDLKERERLMNFVIVGGGPTGVELAGSLAELKLHVLPNDYPDLDFRRMSIHLIEGMGQVLPPMSNSASENARKYLESLDVHIWLNTMVEDYDGQVVKTNKKDLPASNLIWAAGVKGSVIPGEYPEGAVEKSRYVVDAYNRVKGTEGLYALGDVAFMKSEDNPHGHPMLAQVAIQQGANLAKNFIRLQKGQEWKPFQYKDLGTMATIGRNKAVADLGRVKFGGFIGWLLWMGVHLISLIGFRNRLVVLLNWVINYFSYDKKIRLIIRPVERKNLRQSKKLELNREQDRIVEGL